MQNFKVAEKSLRAVSQTNVPSAGAGSVVEVTMITMIAMFAWV